MKRNLLVASGLIPVLVISFLFFHPVEAQQDVSVEATDPLHLVLAFQADASAKSVIDAFAQQGIAYYPEDMVTAFPDPKMGLGSIITVTRALPVDVNDGKKSYSIRTWGTTVGEALAEKNIELGDDDRISPNLATPLQPSMLVTITRVNRTTVKEYETVEYKVIEQDDPYSYRGTNTVVQEGSDGEIEYKYLLIREDGELKSKTLLSTTTTKKVVNKIVKIGTKLRIGETYFGKATWYQNSYGTKVAMDLFPAGTEVRITNMNNGRSIIVVNDGCICGATGVLVDLAPDYFQQLGGTLGQGVLQNIRVEEIL